MNFIFVYVALFLINVFHDLNWQSLYNIKIEKGSYNLKMILSMVFRTIKFLYGIKVITVNSLKLVHQRICKNYPSNITKAKKMKMVIVNYF